MYLFLSVIQISLIGIIVVIEYFNNFILSNSKFFTMIGIKSNEIATIASYERIRLWEVHFISGVLLSLSFYIYAAIVKEKNKPLKMISILAIFSGLYLYLFSNKFILIVHVITVLFCVVKCKFYTLKKV